MPNRKKKGFEKRMGNATSESAKRETSAQRSQRRRGGNATLEAARAEKDDEFYTQYNDVAKEMQAYFAYDPDVFCGKTVLLPCDDPRESNFTKFFGANFEPLGLKKLISTSFVPPSKSPKKGKGKPVHGKFFILDEDTNRSGQIDLDDIKVFSLMGNGDFRSDEVKALRDEADIIVTNPPFSLFREFLPWILEVGKKFAIIGNTNAITYKDVFPLIQSNTIWLGVHNEGRTYLRPDGTEQKMGNTCWFTNLEHSSRNSPMQLMTMEENRKFSRRKIVREKGYQHYDNYDAIEVPYVEAIPSDYPGVMGVPISFLNKYCPEQFEIVGLDRYVEDNPHYGHRFTISGHETYARVLIRRRKRK